MRRSCNTSIAKAMGYMSAPSVEDRCFGNVVINMSQGVISSYHSAGKSAKDTFLEGRRAFAKAIGETRVDRKRKKVLYAR